MYVCLLRWVGGLLAVGAHAEYFADFRSPGEMLGCKRALSGIAGLLERGFTISAWARYNDLSVQVAVAEIGIATTQDDTFFQGFGGTSGTFQFTSTSTFAGYLPTQEFLEWHHYATTYNSTSGDVAHYVDGVQARASAIAHDSASAWHSAWTSGDPLPNLGTHCYHYHTNLRGDPQAVPHVEVGREGRQRQQGKHGRRVEEARPWMAPESEAEPRII